MKNISFSDYSPIPLTQHTFFSFFFLGGGGWGGGHSYYSLTLTKPVIASNWDFFALLLIFFIILQKRKQKRKEGLPDLITHLSSDTEKFLGLKALFPVLCGAGGRVFF